MEYTIGFLPKLEPIEDGDNQIFQFRKVSIVRAEMTRQLPHPIDRIEIRTIRRKKIELDRTAMLMKPWPKRGGVMMTSVVVNVKYFSYPCGKDISHEHGKDISHPFGERISHPPSE